MSGKARPSDQQVFVTNLEDYSNALEQLQVAPYESYFNHQFSHIPTSEILSDLWFTTSTTANASIDRNNAEVNLHLDASTSETASIETNEHGHYSPGGYAIPGMAFRVGHNLSGDQEVWGGYSDGSDGWGIGEDSTGLYIFKDFNSSRTKIRQSNWNTDTLDGSGSLETNPSKLSLTDLQDGHIIRFPYLCYNQGEANVRIGVKRDDGIDFVTVHKFTNLGGPLTRRTNLPLRMEINNGSTAETLDAYIAAVHYHREAPEADLRQNNANRLAQSVGDTNWVPLISFKARTGWGDVNIKPRGLNVNSDTDIELELLLDSDLGANASFGLPNHTSSSETAVQVDTSATSFDTIGEKRWGNYVKGGAGATKFSELSANLDFDIPGKQILTLAAISTGGTATVDSSLQWESDF